MDFFSPNPVSACVLSHSLRQRQKDMIHTYSHTGLFIDMTSVTTSAGTASDQVFLGERAQIQRQWGGTWDEGFVLEAPELPCIDS